MLLDLLIIILVISALYRGRESGFSRQFLATVGFFGGLFAGRWLGPRLLGAADTPEERALLAILTLLGVGFIGLVIGEYAGLHIKRRLLNKLNKLDNGLGSALGVVTVLLSIWLLAAVASNMPFDGLRTTVNNSRIVTSLNRLLPPAPTVIANLSHLINPNGFPDVFIGNEPVPSAKINLPALGELATAVNADKDSVVRLKGQGCGGIVAGSGFVAGPNLVATNAHVVAGIEQPYVQDKNGTHTAQVIGFNPDLDFAVLRVGGLAGKPLTLADSGVPAGTPAAVLGYPGGGDFQADPAAVLGRLRAVGRNIYGSGHTLREIYEIQADISSGNSGGPLIGKDGRVIGIIFAESTTYQEVGYALTTAKAQAEIQAASRRNQTVGTGQCAQ